MPLRALLFLSISGLVCLVTLKKPFWGLCFSALLIYIHPYRFSYGVLGPFHIPLILGICTLIGWLLNYKESKTPPQSSMTVISICGLAIAQLVSSFFAKYDLTISFQWAELTSKIAIYCFLTTRLIHSRERMRNFIIITLIGAGFFSIWGIEQHFGGNDRLEDMAFGLFDESNSMAALWVLTLPLFLFMFLKGSNKIKALGGLMSGALVSSIVFTQSRAGFLGLVAAFVILLLKLPGKQKVFLLFVGLFSSLIFIFSAGDIKNYWERLTSIGAKEAGESRLLAWRAGWEAFKDQPLTGVGQQNFQYLAKGYFEKLRLPMPFRERLDVHNTALLMLYEGGVLSFLFYLSAIYFYFRESIRLRKILKKDPNRQKYAILLTTLEAGTIGFLVCAMTHSWPVFEPFYWFLVIPSIMKNIYVHELKSEKLSNNVPNRGISVKES